MTHLGMELTTVYQTGRETKKLIGKIKLILKEDHSCEYLTMM